jgi:hypothetical protein
MTTADVKSTIKRHRTAAFAGGGVGLVLLIGWIAYNSAMTPTRPIIQTAKAGDVVDYISNSRGLASLARVEQRQFLDQWKSHVMQEGPKRELKAHFEGMDEDARKRFVESITPHFTRAFLDEAQAYAELTSPDDRHKFVMAKLQQHAGEALILKDVARSFKNDFRGGPDDVQRWILENTTPEERAIGEPYADALKRIREQKRQQEQAPKSPTASVNPR